KTEHLLRQLLASRSGRSSERLSEDQLALFAAELQAQVAATAETTADDDRGDDTTAKPGDTPKGNSRGRRPIPAHLKRERIVHDLSDAEKHCKVCDEQLRRIGEEISERYEYIPAQMTVIEDVCIKYACTCTVQESTVPLMPNYISSITAAGSPFDRVYLPAPAHFGLAGIRNLS